MNERSISKNLQDTDSIVRAITKRDEGYNDLVIEKPEVAGIYCKWFDDVPLSDEVSLVNTDKAIYDKWWTQMKVAMSKNIPIFVLTPDNHTKMLYDIDPEKLTFRVAAAEIMPEHMVDLPGIYKQHLGDEERKKAIGRVFDKVSGILTEEQRQKFAPDGSESAPDASAYLLY